MSRFFSILSLTTICHLVFVSCRVPIDIDRFVKPINNGKIYGEDREAPFRPEVDDPIQAEETMDEVEKLEAQDYEGHGDEDIELLRKKRQCCGCCYTCPTMMPCGCGCCYEQGAQLPTGNLDAVEILEGKEGNEGKEKRQKRQCCGCCYTCPTMMPCGCGCCYDGGQPLPKADQKDKAIFEESALPEREIPRKLQ